MQYMESITEFVTEGHLQRCSRHLVSRLLLCLTLILSFHCAHAQEVVYERVTEENQLVDGGKYIIVDVDIDYAAGWQDTNNRKGVSIAEKREDNFIKGITLATTNIDHDNVYEFSLYRKVGATEWGLYDVLNKGFLYAPNLKNGNNMRLASDNDGDVPLNAAATIQFATTNEGKVLTYIRFPGGTSNDKRITLDRNTLSGTVYFSCYDRTISTPSIALFRKRVGIFSISQYGYTTYTCKYRYRMPQGCTGFVVSKVVDEREKVLLLAERYKEGDIVPEGTALLIKGDEGEYSVYQTARKADVELTESVNAENLLHGDFDADGNVNYDIANKDKYEYFKLGLKGGLNFGFYWGSQDGSPFKMSRTDRAYLVLPREETGQVKGLVLDDAMVETGIVSHAGQTSTSGKVYDLSGRICRGVLAPGIYIRDGRKVLIGK